MGRGVPVHSPEDLKLMRQAGAIVGNTLAMLAERVKPGVRTADLDEWARESLSRAGAVASFPKVIHPELGTPFPGAICTSVNDEIVHGIPSDRVLNEGDIVSIDLGAIYKGFHGDSAVTVPVGTVSSTAHKLLDGTRESLRRGIEKVGPERPLYDVSAAIDKYATSKGLGIVRQYVGHGIGRSMHEPPQIPNYHMHTPGPPMKPGWALAIEPMLNLGSEDTQVMPDRWTVATADGSLSAHFEHTVAVTARGHQIMSLPDESVKGDVR